MPSAMTMALSTGIPMAMISAPRLMRYTLIPKTNMKKKGALKVSASVAATTTAARVPMNSASTPITTITEMARLIRKLPFA